MKPWLAALALGLAATVSACDEASRADRPADPTEVCSPTASPDTSQAVPADLTSLVDRMAQALTCPGHVAHIVERSRTEFQSDLGNELHTIRSEYWLDMSKNVVRESRSETRWGLHVPKSIIRSDGWYYTTDETGSQRSDPVHCLGEHLLPVTHVTGICAWLWPDPSRAEIDIDSHATWSGRPALAISMTGSWPGTLREDDPKNATYTLHLDRETYRPLGSSVVIDFSTQTVPRATDRTETTFYVDFMPSTKLAADFFEPRSVGYVEGDLNAELDALGDGIYWLGEEFRGIGDIPPLALAFDDVSVLGDAVPDHLGRLSYHNPTDYGDSVHLDEYGVDARRDDQPEDPFIPRSDCLAERRELQLADGYAVIYGTAEKDSNGDCPAAAHFQARAFLQDTRVTIDTGTSYSDQSFNSAEAMEHLLRGLRRRQ